MAEETQPRLGLPPTKEDDVPSSARAPSNSHLGVDVAVPEGDASSSSPSSTGSRSGPRPPLPMASDALMGQIVDARYKVTGILATGGMGRIYTAEHLLLGRTIALKVVHNRFVEDGSPADDDAATFRGRFLREANILAKLQHPHIVTLFDYGRLPDIEGSEQYFMAMEYLAGETLQRRLKRVASMPWQEAVSVIEQVALGLRAAHTVGVVHRDLKPGNIMLVEQADGPELVKLIDFGIVKVVGPDKTADLTQEGIIVGSPNYMAPEQVLGQHIDGRTDLYALGIILYQCLTGVQPFERGQSMQTMLAQVNKDPPPFHVSNSGLSVPEGLEELVRALLAKSPNNRPASADAFLEMLSVFRPGSKQFAALRLSGSNRTMNSTGMQATDAALARDVVNASGAHRTPQKLSRWVIGASIVATLLALLVLRRGSKPDAPHKPEPSAIAAAAPAPPKAAEATTPTTPTTPGEAKLADAQAASVASALPEASTRAATVLPAARQPNRWSKPATPSVSPEPARKRLDIEMGR